MCTFQVLKGLPGDGPVALPFPEDGQGAFREGLVVRFGSEHGNYWVGNFQRSHLGADSDFVLEHPNGREVIVIAGGDGYVIDPDKRRQVAKLGLGDIQFARRIDRHDFVLLGDGLSFCTIGANGIGWHSERISWDGIRNVAIEYPTLFAEAWSYWPDAWHPFELDLRTGNVKGGVYKTGWTRGPSS